MKIFVAGATGVIGRELLPMLVAEGHEVAGMTRKPERASEISDAGATPVVCDVYDARLTAAVADFGPEVVINQITDLPAKMAMFPLKIAGLNKARTTGNDALIAAAKAAGARRYVAQSVAFSAPSIVGKAVAHLERSTLAFPGVVIRYGYFYGPGTWYHDGTKQAPRIHVKMAAAHTVDLVDVEPGIYTVTYDGVEHVTDPDQ